MSETGPDNPPRSGWRRLLLVAALAALAGAFSVANWRDRTFSLIFATVSLKAGIVIIASVAMGFALGWAFLWSMSGPE